MNFEDVINVCRLCLGKDRLMKIFHNRIEIPDNMEDIIQTTTGVVISPSDDVSQNICRTCVYITLKMFKFRRTSLVNDLKLKETAALISGRTLRDESVTLLFENQDIPEIDSNSIVSIDENEIRYLGETELEVTREPVQKKSGKQIKTSERDRSPKSETILSSDVENPQAEALPETAHNKRNRTKDSAEITIENRVITQIDNKKKRKRIPSLSESKTKQLKVDSSNETDNSVNCFLELKYVNEYIFLCDICNSILYNAKSLKKHRIKHMRCSICKRSFRSMEETEEHSRKYCPIKQMMNNLPTVRLQRCDQSKDIRQQYASAFGTALEEQLEMLSTKQKSKYIEQDIPHQKTTRELAEQISLISDEEDTTFKIDPHHKPLSDEPKVNLDIHDSSLNEKECSTRNASQKRLQSFILSEKPKIEIIGENVFKSNLDTDETSLVRDLLTLSKELSMKTDLPSEADIIPQPNKDRLFEFRNLKGFLNYYTIPVHIAYAPQKSAKYGTDSSLLARYHRLSWSAEKESTMASSEVTHSMQNDSTLIPSPPILVDTPSQACLSIMMQNGTNAALKATDSSNNSKGRSPRTSSIIQSDSSKENLQNNTIVKKNFRGRNRTNIKNNPIASDVQKKAKFGTTRLSEALK